MGCGSTSSGALTGRGFRSETITGTLPGMGGCGCGCSATAETVVGFMPGAGPSRRTMARQASGVLPGVLFPSASPDFTGKASARRHMRGLAGRAVPVDGGGASASYEAAVILERIESIAETMPTVTSWVPDPAGCEDAFEGSTFHCYIPDPYEEGWVSIDDLEAMDIYAHEDTVELVNTDSDEKVLLLTAWELLHQNKDLVEWAACMVLGSDASDVDRLVSKIERTSRTVRIRITGDCTDFWGDSFGFHAWSGASGGTIEICMYTNHWVNHYLPLWTESIKAVDKWCSALDLAVTLLHELTHTIGLSGGDVAGTCEESYLIENMFRFALFRRHPTITNSACCSGYWDAGWLVGESGAVWVNANDCITVSSSTGWSTEEWIETKSSMEESPTA